MGEIKSVKVDNWGVFFLQKLQNFFNKTDYCDLTLQFNDNSQLKVHRLVLSACTDFFNVLEQSCEMIDDVLIMPPELQADVVVPIVNFMYTGTLEFELIMYGRLLKTAKDMNMTVLLKLLEAHRRTMENKSQVNKSIQKVAPKQVRRMPYNSTTKIVEQRKYITQSQSTSTQQQRRTPVASTVPKYKTLQIKPVSQNIFPRMLSEPAQILSKYPHSKTPVKGPSRFDCAEDTLPPETFEKSFDNISYESKPLICKEEPDAYDYDNLIRKHETYASPFEQLRRSYTNVNNKRPASSLSSYESPPEKKPNIQDVKEYAEQQRMRKQIAEEFDDDQEYDDTLDDEFHNDDDDDEYIPPQSVRKQVKQQQQQFRAQQQAKQAQAKTGQQTVQVHKTSPKSDNSPRATIVVKDSTSKSLNHAKVICEVLRKYPHIVKNNKSIKLKVMPQSNNAQKIVIKKEMDTNEVRVEEKQSAPVAAVTKQPLPSTSTSNTTPTAAVAPTQPRRIDSKTMHALIAMGAENKAGPWLCLRCGVNGRPISIPSYRGFRRHLINVHKEKIDPRLCEHCGWRSTNNKDLTHHLLVQHSVKTEHSYNFPKCEYCTQICIDYDTLNKHITEKHSVKKEPQVCIYCNVSFSEEMQLYTHMRSFHKQRAIEDGVLDFSDEEMSIGETSEINIQEQVSTDSRINIISDISLSKNLPIIQATAIPANGSTITIQSAAATTATTTTTSSSLNIIENTTEEESQMLANEFIGTDSSQGPKFINAQGTEMELTPAQREEIISQLDQQHDGIVMVLNEEPFDANVAASTRPTQNNAEEITTSEPVADNSMFIVCGQEPDMENEISMPASLDRAKSKSKDPLEWVEEEIASHTDSVDKETKNDENENEIAKDNSEEETQEKSPEADLATEAKVEEKDDEIKDEHPTPKVANDTPVEDTLEMKLKLLTDWTDDEEEDEDVPEKEKASQSHAAEEEKITSDEILFETLTKEDKPAEDQTKNDVKEKTPEAQVETDVDHEIDEEDGDKLQEDEEIGNAEVEKEEEKETSPVPEQHEDDEDEEAIENKEEEIKEADIESQEDEPAHAEEDQETHEPEDKLTEDDTKKDNEKTASGSKDDKEERTLITRAELRNIMSDWGDDEEEEI